jgi:insertion element IS1 protein InsB
VGLPFLYREAERAAKVAGSRNPYELLKAIGAIKKISHEYDPEGLRGFATIICDQMFVVINGHMHEDDRRIVAGHEAAHLILHKAEIQLSPARALIPPAFLTQSKAETHLIESNNMPQRHWFARFRRKTCVVSRSEEMVDLTTMLYAGVHVNKMIEIAI